MSKLIYLAFINNYFPRSWINLGNDLRSNIPVPFAPLKIDVDMKLYYSADRNQYHSTLILAQVIKQIPKDGWKIVGITNVDLFIPILTFLFGEAQLAGKGAIVSTHRLHNEYYGLPEDSELLYNRLHKEILHELGHTLGLVHCRDYECVMTPSSYVGGIDLKRAKFCAQCRTLSISAVMS